MSYRSTVLGDSPAAYWRLAETSGSAVDETGHTSSAVYSGTKTQGVAGLLLTDTDLAVSFAGAGKATTSGEGIFSPGVGGAYSCEGWIKTSSASGTIFASDAGSPFRFFQFRVFSSKLQLIVFDNSGSFQVLTSAASVDNGVAHHVVGTYDGSTIKLYIDGVLDSSVAFSAAPPTGSHAIAIGDQLAGVSSLPWTGTLDELAFYQSTLSSTQVAAHYAAATGSVGIRVSQEAIEALAAFPGKARVSQEAIEGLYSPTTRAARVSQEAIEVLFLPPPGKDHLSQLAVEALIATSHGSWISQAAIEVLTPRPGSRLSQVAIETLIAAEVQLGIRFSQDALEVLEANPAAVASLEGGIFSQTVLEALRSPSPIVADLSQVTLEVLRPYTNKLFAWSRFGLR